MPKLDLLRQTHGGIRRRIQPRSPITRALASRIVHAHLSAARSRSYSQDANPRSTSEERKSNGSASAPEPEQGAMSRLLQEMTEDSLATNPRRSSKTVQEAGFSEDLKRRLEERIASGAVAPEHQQAASVVSMPSSAGKGTRDLAEALPWKGSEKMEDTALRMLEDAHKPLRGAAGRRPVKPGPVDMRLKHQSKGNRAERLANARDKTSIYSLSQEVGMTEKEKEETRRIFKERFQPGARSVPASIQGLQSLASERIEDAIGRGLFKNIPRGKGVNVERDYAASSPFIDTTEYFMNKIIQKQEVLPPWVEKQQEVTRTIGTFRARLRNDWKRHAARMIASKGGSLEERVHRAERYAAAEALANPRSTKTETIASIDGQGNLTKVKVTETPPEAKPAADVDAVLGNVSETTLEVKAATTPIDGSPLLSQIAPTITVTTETPLEASPSPDPSLADSASPAPSLPLSSSAPSPSPLPPPFRDPDWEATELSYHTLALTQLNNLTRSYNLMAPELARKPYFRLDRELKAAFADVAPLLADEIRARARAPPDKMVQDMRLHKSGGVLERLGRAEKVRVWESRRPMYGFKEFWRELWKRKETE